MLTQVLTWNQRAMLPAPHGGLCIETIWASDDERRKAYEEAATNLSYWVWTARILKQSADRIDWMPARIIGDRPEDGPYGPNRGEWIVVHDTSQPELGRGLPHMMSFGPYGASPNGANVFCMLMGMAIEVLVKATLIKEGEFPVETSADGSLRMRREILSHDVLGMASRITSPGFTITPKDEELFERIEQYVKWNGRYPVPLFDSDYIPRWDDAREDLRELYDRLLNLVAPPEVPAVQEAETPAAELAEFSMDAQSVFAVACAFWPT